jgi:hypothetical protein
LGILGLLAISLALLFCGLREDWPAYVGTPACMMGVGGWVVVAMLGIVATVGFARPRWPAPRFALLALQVALTVFVALLGSFAWESFRSLLTFMTTANFNLASTALVAVSAIGVGTAITIAMRQAAPSLPSLFALSVALVACSVGMIVVGVVSPIIDIGGIVLSHLLPALLCGVIVWAGGVRFARW